MSEILTQLAGDDARLFLEGLAASGVAGWTFAVFRVLLFLVGFLLPRTGEVAQAVLKKMDEKEAGALSDADLQSGALVVGVDGSGRLDVCRRIIGEKSTPEGKEEIHEDLIPLLGWMDRRRIAKKARKMLAAHRAAEKASKINSVVSGLA